LIQSGCDGLREQVITGRTMGTTCSVTVVTGHFGSIAGLQEKIDRPLQEINHSMSPYLEDSEISRFNRCRHQPAETRGRL
jgi:thiamine biosynthesis lipoprotein